MMDGRIIAVSGIMGSGKTTLCRALSKKISWTCLPEPENAKKYLMDFFSDLDRYAYPTQMAFLCSKALQILQLLQRDRNIIIDRSLYEDIHIFAKCWHDRGNIDERDYAVYSSLSNFFLELIPKPLIIIYCECSINEAKNRIQKRDRFDQRNFPDGHLEDIFERYTNWVSTYNQTLFYKINTEQYDVRSEKVVNQIVKEIREICSVRQITFFDFENEESKVSHILEPINTINDDNMFSQHELFLSKNIHRNNLIHPWVYLAAPFSSMTSNAFSQDEKQLFFSGITMSHERIEYGKYRQMLLNVEKKLKAVHLDTFIPHRDINMWGDEVLSAEHINRECTSFVKECDLFVGLLGDSCGSHYEFGIAEGQSIPSVIIQCSEISTSFISQGLISEGNRLVLKCQSISEIPGLLSNDEFLRFINKYVNF